MIEEKPLRFGPVILASGDDKTTIYTLPSNKTAVLNCINICNATSTSKTVQVWVVGVGITAGNTDAIINGITIPAYGVLTWELNKGIPLTAATEKIQAKASAASSLTFTGGGVEF